MAVDSISVPLGFLRRLMGGFFGQSHGGARNLYQAFGYDPVVTIDRLLEFYYRGGIASRIVRAFPQATWRDMPIIRDEKGDSAQEKTKSGGKESKNKNYSPFVESVEDFFERFNVMRAMERVDRLSGVGQYAILVMGFGGGEDLAMPLESGKRELLFLQPYSEKHAQITDWEMSVENPRYGMPLIYTVQQAKPVTGGNSVGGSLRVHHSRVLHVAEILDDNEVYGVPRLYPVINHLFDLQKVTGAGAETYWHNARQGIAFVGDKDANVSVEVLADMKKQAEEFEHSLRRTMALQNVTPHVLNANMVDPGPLIDKLLDLIAGTVNIPKRILIGSERGELGGDNDESNWSATIDERRKNFAGPMLLRPFVQTMIDTGNIVEPNGEFWIEWPEPPMAPEKKAQVALSKSQALATYANSPNSEHVVPISEFRKSFLEIAPESEYEAPEELEPIDEADPMAREQFGRRGLGEEGDTDEREVGEE